MSRHQFRFLVVLNQLLILATFFVAELTFDSLPFDFRTYSGGGHSVLDNEFINLPSLSDIPYWLWMTAMLIGFVAAAGLCLGRRWGRTLYVVSLLIGFLIAPLTEFYLDSGWTVFVGGLAATTDGMILALIYFSPVRRMFKKEKTDNQVNENEMIESL
jgi:hypothetical protein